MSENRGYLSSLVLCGIQATYLVVTKGFQVSTHKFLV